MARDWTNLTKTTRFHVPGNAEAPYDTAQVAVHKRVLTTGLIFASVGLLAGIAYGIAAIGYAVSEFRGNDPGKSIQALLFGIPFAIVVPVAFYFYGTSMALLFTPSAFLQGPIGKKWLKIAGVKSPIAARVLCLLLFVFSTAILVAIVVLIRLDSK